MRFVSPWRRRRPAPGRSEAALRSAHAEQIYRTTHAEIQALLREPPPRRAAA